MRKEREGRVCAEAGSRRGQVGGLEGSQWRELSSFHNYAAWQVPAGQGTWATGEQREGSGKQHLERSGLNVNGEQMVTGAMRMGTKASAEGGVAEDGASVEGGASVGHSFKKFGFERGRRGCSSKGTSGLKGTSVGFF